MSLELSGTIIYNEHLYKISWNQYHTCKEAESQQEIHVWNTMFQLPHDYWNMEWVSKHFRKYWCLGAASVKKPTVSNLPKMMLQLPLGWTDCFFKNYTLRKFEVFMECSDDVPSFPRLGHSRDLWPASTNQPPPPHPNRHVFPPQK